MKNLKWIFQGDSITDAARDKRNYHDMGTGYPKYAAANLVADHPNAEFDFYNFGISGNRTCQLFDRLYKDCIEFDPDVVSVLIGVNDAWHRYGNEKIATTDEQIETNYRAILDRLKNETHAKIIMMSPYVLTDADKEWLVEDVKRIDVIVKRLADEYADVFIPLDEIFAEALKTQPEPKHYSNDGVHPNKNGAEFIGRVYADAVKGLIEKL